MLVICATALVLTFESVHLVNNSQRDRSHAISLPRRGIDDGTSRDSFTDRKCSLLNFTTRSWWPLFTSLHAGSLFGDDLLFASFLLAHTLCDSPIADLLTIIVGARIFAHLE